MMEMQTEPTKPRLADVEAQNFETEEEKVENERRETERTLMTRVIQASALACIVINIVAMAIYGGAVVVIAGIIGGLVSCGVIYFQEELRNEDSKFDLPPFFCFVFHLSPISSSSCR